MAPAKTPLEIYEEQSIRGQRDALMTRMLNAIINDLDSGMTLTEEEVLEPYLPDVVHGAIVGLAILLLTNNVRRGEDLRERVEVFLSDVRAAYDCDHPDDAYTVH